MICYYVVSHCEGTDGILSRQSFSPSNPPRRLVQLSFWCPGGECGTVSLESGSSGGAVCAQRWKFLQELFLRVTVNSCIWYVAVWATSSVFPSRDGSWSISWLILTTFSNRSGMWWVGSGNSWKSQSLCMLKITEDWPSHDRGHRERRGGSSGHRQLPSGPVTTHAAPYAEKDASGRSSLFHLEISEFQYFF